MFFRKVAAAALSVTMFAGLAQAATITNGSFEAPGTFTGTFQELGSGSAGLPGWTVGGNGVDLIYNYWTDHDDGSYSLDLSRRNAGRISQTVTGLTVGSTYQITFAMAGNPSSGSAIKTLDASMGMAGGGTFTFDTTGKSLSNMGWVDKSFTFTALQTSGLLSFVSKENNAYGPALDNIRIAELSAVPLPAGGLLLIGAFGMMAAARRRKG